MTKNKQIGDLGEQLAAEYLLNKGYKRILHLCHGNNQSGLRKQAGYRDAYLEKGLEPDENLIQYAPIESTQEKTAAVRDFLCQLNNEGLHFDAIFTSEDELAIAATRYAQKMKISIPNDLGIVGYNNSNLCLYTEPELSSVAVRLPVLC